MKFNNVAEILANQLKKYIKDVFMLTGYGAMYLNDALKQSGIRFYVSRNEAAAPMMAEAYSKAGADAIKFQTFKANNLLIKNTFSVKSIVSISPLSEGVCIFNLRYS